MLVNNVHTPFLFATWRHQGAMLAFWLKHHKCKRISKRLERLLADIDTAFMIEFGEEYHARLTEIIERHEIETKRYFDQPGRSYDEVSK